MSSKYIARGSAIAARQLGSEMVIMSVADSTLFNLNEVGAAIWQAADGRTPLREIVETKICQQFEIDAETAYQDAEDFVVKLASHGILLVSDQPIPERP